MSRRWAVGAAVLALLAASTPLARAVDPVTAGGSADLRLAWREPSGPVAPGESVETPLVVTNHGPATATQLELTMTVLGDHWPGGPYEDVAHRCWTDPGVVMCLLSDLAPGQSVTLPVGWRFPREAAGTTYEAPASVSGVPDDPDTSNNADSVHFVIAAPPPAPHRPARDATAGAAVTAGVAAGALVVAGGAVLLWRRSRRAR